MCFLTPQNITVRRVKKDRVCHISPLPPYLPRPKELAAGLRMVISFITSANRLLNGVKSR